MKSGDLPRVETFLSNPLGDSGGEPRRGGHSAGKGVANGGGGCRVVAVNQVEPVAGAGLWDLFASEDDELDLCGKL